MNWASLLWDSFQLRCKKVKPGMDFFVAPMLFHLYKFEGKLSDAELLVYEEAVANRSLLEDQNSAAKGSEMEEEEPISAMEKPEAPIATRRLLRRRMENPKIQAMFVSTRRLKDKGPFINLGSDDDSCPLEGKFRGVMDEICRANAANANMVDELLQKFDQLFGRRTCSAS